MTFHAFMLFSLKYILASEKKYFLFVSSGFNFWAETGFTRFHHQVLIYLSETRNLSVESHIRVHDLKQSLNTSNGSKYVFDLISMKKA